MHLSLSELWAAISNSRYRSLCGDRKWDVFEERQEALSAHAEIFSTTFLKSYPFVRRDFAFEEGDDQGVFGIEILSTYLLRFMITFISQVNTDDDHPSFVPTRWKLTLEHSTYP